MQPRIHTATLAEIRSVIPAEVLAETPVDPVGVGRFRKLISLTKGFDYKSIIKLNDPKLTPTARAQIGHLLFLEREPQIKQVKSLINEGELQFPLPKNTPDEFESIGNIRNFVKVLAGEATYSTEHQNVARAVEMLEFSLLIDQRLLDSHGPIINYLIVNALRSITTKSIVDCCSTQGFPVPAMRELLTKLPAQPKSDKQLSEAIRTDFQRYTLPTLTDPVKSIRNMTENPDALQSENQEPIAGTYEPIETAKAMGTVVKVAMANALVPLSEFDHTATDLEIKVSKDLPAEVNTSKPDGMEKTWDKAKFRFAMNNGHNTLGRQIIALSFVSEPGMVEGSGKVRANVEALRIFLASKIYRSEHNGQLPASRDELGSLLGGWPTDPYNGKPMIYNAKKELAYSVGKDLVDNGGDIGVTYKAKDVGLRLKP